MLDTNYLTNPTDQYQYDVFLSYNSHDKPQIKVIDRKLRDHGLNPWLDQFDALAGQRFQEVIQGAISLSKSGAIFLGSAELGLWQKREVDTLMRLSIEEGRPVIPVLLPGVSQIPEAYRFLQDLNYVQFVRGIDDTEALNRLESGITGLPILRLHMQGPAVARLQEWLRSHKFYRGVVDSNFGPATQAAVIALQHTYKLYVDGIVGSATWRIVTGRLKPGSIVSLSILSLGIRGPAVTRLQELLKTTGLYQGPVDGIFGRGTQAAVRAFQRNHKLPPDGVVGTYTWRRLLQEFRY